MFVPLTVTQRGIASLQLFSYLFGIQGRLDLSETFLLNVWLIGSTNLDIEQT
jgi:hypothetical protein